LFRPGQGGAVQEAQGADGLVETAPRDAALQQVQLVGADVVGTEPFGRTAEMPGEGSHLADVGVDRSLGVIAQAQVVDEALSKRGHGASSTCEKKKRPGRNPERTWRTKRGRRGIGTRQRDRLTGAGQQHWVARG